MKNSIKAAFLSLLILSISLFAQPAYIDGNTGWLNNGVMKLGIDSNYGGAIVYVSHADSTTNLVNVYDHGRLIQQSYYAGKSLNRQDQGQHPSWSPWFWNPVQGGNWAGEKSITLALSTINAGTILYSESQPRLWDMDQELAQATMQQWMQFEPGMNNVIRVDNRLISWRSEDDIWGDPVFRHQECPAVYLIRDMEKVVFYDGDNPWQNEPLTVVTEHSGPPWQKYYPTENWMACVYPNNDFGVGIYSTYDDQFWYVGSVGSSGGASSSSTMHIAAINGKSLDYDTIWSYTYWIIIGDVNTIRARAYQLKNRADPPLPPPLADLNRDGRVDIKDAAIIAKNWLNTDCFGPYWCDRANLTHSGDVSIADLKILISNWLAIEAR